MGIAINYFAVFAAAIASIIIGFIWYGPLFGTLWMRLSGISDTRLAELKAQGMGKKYALMSIMSLFMTYVLAHFVAIWGVVGGAISVAGAFQLAFWIWLGFIVPTLIGSHLWEGKSLKLYFLNIAYYLVNLSAMTLTLVMWG